MPSSSLSVVCALQVSGALPHYDSISECSAGHPMTYRVYLRGCQAARLSGSVSRSTWLPASIVRVVPSRRVSRLCFQGLGAYSLRKFEEASVINPEGGFILIARGDEPPEHRRYKTCLSQRPMASTWARRWRLKRCSTGAFWMIAMIKGIDPGQRDGLSTCCSS